MPLIRDKLKVVVFDCCMFKSGKQAHQIKKPANFMVVHSSQLNRGAFCTAEDGANYSHALAQLLQERDGSLIDLFLELHTRIKNDLDHSRFVPRIEFGNSLTDNMLRARLVPVPNADAPQAESDYSSE